MLILWVIFSLLIFVYCAVWYYFKTTVWCRSQTCLVGKTAIVTEANNGIGYESALDFAKRGARVILACRDLQKAEEAKNKIIKKTGNENVMVKLLDMSSFDSARAFANEINKTEDRLDILVNNAGIVADSCDEDERSSDGHVLLMQVNHFSSFLLTNLLMNLLKKSKPSRIVNVSSQAAWLAIDFDLNKIDQNVSNSKDYNNSKLCNILFTKELANKLQGSGVTTYSVHPGFVKTGIFDKMQGLKKIAVSIAVGLFARTAEEGAQTTIYCSVAKGIEEHDGEHFADCQKVAPYKSASDLGLPRRLWEKSEEIVQLKAEENQF